MSAWIWECEYHVMTHTCVITRVCVKDSRFKFPTLDMCSLCVQLLPCGCQQVCDVRACHTMDDDGYPIG